MNMRWHVLRSKPNKEMPLWRELVARGLDCFYPQLPVHPVNPRSRKNKPYFPGYLFLHMDIEQVGASTFQWMPFSAGLVSFGGVPATIPDSFIQAIRYRLDEINVKDSRQLAELKSGDTVVIAEGPFSGYEAILDSQLPGRERVRVLLTFLHAQQMNLELPVQQIRRNMKNGR